MEVHEMTGILEGVKVVDMGQVAAIPVAGAMLADWGADVIKIEPLRGEQYRGLTRTQGVVTGVFNVRIELYNRGKRSLAVDLKQEAGLEIFYKLIKESDVFMSNYRANALKRLHVDYGSLSQINPGLIYATITGYGTVGPDKDDPGYDLTAAWARTGIMHLLGDPGCPPPMARTGMIDRMAAGYACAGICGALLNREKTGKGQELELSLFHTGIWDINADIQSAVIGTPFQKHDRTRAGNPLQNTYRTSDDRWIQLAMLQSDRFWPDFCRVIERPELEHAPRFDGMEMRTQNCEELIRILDQVMATKTLQEWNKLFKETDFIYGLVATPQEVTTDPQALASGVFTEVDHPATGKTKLVSTPVNFSQNPAAVKAPAPEIGQHDEEILLELGYDWEDIGRFKDQFVIL
jgi:crotonobetainyl-CoA:carnitine CoA-transferase CaiB-like acyl-CoA transferase